MALSSGCSALSLWLSPLILISFTTLPCPLVPRRLLDIRSSWLSASGQQVVRAPSRCPSHFSSLPWRLPLQSGGSFVGGCRKNRKNSTNTMFALDYIPFLFLGITLLRLNQEMNYLLQWQTILLISSLAALAGAYTLKNVYLLAGGLVSISMWWTTQADLWGEKINVAPASVVAGIGLIATLFYTLGRLHEWNPRAKRFALTYLVFGLVSATVILFIFSTGLGLEGLEELTDGAPITQVPQVLLSLLVFAIAIVAALVMAVMKKLIFPGELAGVLIVAALIGSIAFLPAQPLVKGDSYGFSRELTSTGIIWASIFNIALLAELVGIVFMGYARRATWLINLGALGLFIFIFTKYFDWFFSFLNKSVFFIGAGLLLFLLGWGMERGRRRMLARMRAQAPQP